MHPAHSNPPTLDGESQQDGGEPELAPWGAKLAPETPPCALPPTVAYKAWSAALALSVASSIPAYLVPVALPVDSQCAFVAFSKIELHSPFVSHSLTVPPLYFCPRPSLRLSCSPNRQQCQRKSPPRTSSNELGRRVLESTRRLSMEPKCRNTSQTRLKRTTRVP